MAPDLSAWTLISAQAQWTSAALSFSDLIAPVPCAGTPQAPWPLVPDLRSLLEPSKKSLQQEAPQAAGCPQNPYKPNLPLGTASLPSLPDAAGSTPSFPLGAEAAGNAPDGTGPGCIASAGAGPVGIEPDGGAFSATLMA